MAKLGKNTSLIGSFSGKVGGIIGSSWKGIPYIKAAHKSRTKKISDKEKGNRSRFAMAQAWLKPLLEFVRVGFKGYTPTVEGYIAAKSYLMKNAMEGTGADSTINPALVRVSFGDLPLSENMAVELLEDNQLRFTWSTELPNDAHPCDQVMLLVIDVQHHDYDYREKNESHNHAYDFTTTGQFRETGSDTIYLPEAPGYTYQVYAAFVAHDRSRQSHSVYLGEIKV
jgi:hypothetical protein